MEETTTTTITTRQPLYPAPVTHIPLDLVAEILCLLPVKFLLQFRCVCKSWKTLISDDPKFTKKHLRFSTKRKHLLVGTWSSVQKLTLMSYPLHSLPIQSIFTTKPTQLQHSSINLKDDHNFIASCDGLICFAINQRLALLWNHSIRKFKNLPYLDIPHAIARNVYAFGYDPFIDNYKVVSVCCYDFEYDGGIHEGCKTQVCKTQVNVYTLGTHSWRRISDFPSIIPRSEPGIIVNGTVNWFAYSNVSCNFSGAIVSLDLGKECYQEIPQPNYEIPVNLTLGMTRDCLCVFSQSYSFNDVWLMNEYGNKDSWIKLIRLSHFSIAEIIYISEDDNHVLLLSNEVPKFKWVVYDSKNDTRNSFHIMNALWVESKVYVESLISP